MKNMTYLQWTTQITSFNTGIFGNFWPHKNPKDIIAFTREDLRDNWQ